MGSYKLKAAATLFMNTTFCCGVSIRCWQATILPKLSDSSPDDVGSSPAALVSLSLTMPILSSKALDTSSEAHADLNLFRTGAARGELMLLGVSENA